MPAGVDPFDIFQNGQWYSRSGVPIVPSVLAQSGMPVILPSSSATGIAANGALTLTTALPQVYPSAWCFFPAGAVSGDATGGLYYCVFTSTTQCTVYAGKVGDATGASANFAPSAPASLTAAVGSGAAYVQTTGAEIAMCNVKIPGGSLGPNGAISVTHTISCPATANTKLFRCRFAGQAVAGLSFSTLNAGGRFGVVIQNRGSQSSQVSNNSGGSYVPYSTGSNASLVFAINTAVHQNITLHNQIGVDTDYAVMDAFTFEIYPA